MCLPYGYIKLTQPLWAKVDMGVMSMKRCPTIPKGAGLYHLMVKCYIQNTCWVEWGYYLCIDAVSVFYSPSWLGSHYWITKVNDIIQELWVMNSTETKKKKKNKIKIFTVDKNIEEWCIFAYFPYHQINISWM